jgi:signal transduction histidine kinase
VEPPPGEYNLRSIPRELTTTYGVAMMLRRPDPVDALLVALMVAEQVELWATHPHPGVSIVVLHVMAPGALLVRRRTPLAATLITLASQAALLQLMPQTLSTWFLGVLVSIAVIGSLPLPVSLTGLLGIFGVCVEGAFLDQFGGGAGDLAFSFAIMGGAWSLGLLVGRRGASARSLAARSAELERQRDHVAEEAVAAERARVTRELHDVVAHGLTVLVVQTVAAADAIEHGAAPSDVLTRLRTSERVARESLSELRVLLGILGEGQDGRPIAAVTGLPGVRELVAQFRATGHRISLEVAGEERPLGPGLSMTMYRVVQEALTNVLKHADGAPTKVTISFPADRVSISVVNGPGDAGPLTTEGAGRGLAGLAERTHLYGGTFWSGSGADGGYEVGCDLPDPADDVDGARRPTTEQVSL